MHVLQQVVNASSSHVTISRAKVTLTLKYQILPLSIIKRNFIYMDECTFMLL